jgi:hypothetical protein
MTIEDQDQDSRLRTTNKWYICKEGKAGNKKSQRRGLLVFSELPSLPSAGSRPGYFHTSLGCKLRSLIRFFLGWFDYSKKCGEFVKRREVASDSNQWRAVCGSIVRAQKEKTNLIPTRHLG